ncbi:hypothetical protein Tco_0724908 [Tanacetum coccineum]|uniref:Uncharacterized protein n=1 Tax=Tanacetum coccineum TaxID=301880 RepID=A0ABQ4YDR6_9ASTR
MEEWTWGRLSRYGLFAVGEFKGGGVWTETRCVSRDKQTTGGIYGWGEVRSVICLEVVGVCEKLGVGVGCFVRERGAWTDTCVGVCFSGGGVGEWEGSHWGGTERIRIGATERISSERVGGDSWTGRVGWRTFIGWGRLSRMDVMRSIVGNTEGW